MPVLRIDGREVTVAAGATVLEAARVLGIDIPALCFVEGCAPATSCLACVVRVRGQDRLLPSCGVPARDGMEVECETPELRTARRTALELLLGDHLGDCLAPCHRICPVDLEIPRMLRRIRAGERRAAVRDIRGEVPLAAVLERVCPAPCESGCRRGEFDAPVAIRALAAGLLEEDLALAEPVVPEALPERGGRVAVVGGGPAGLAAAWFLRLRGLGCTVFEREARPGGMLRDAVAAGVLPAGLLDAETRLLARAGVELRAGEEVGGGISVEVLRRDFAAVLLAVGGDKTARTRVGIALAADALPPEVWWAGDGGRGPLRPVRAAAEGKRLARLIAGRLTGSPAAREKVSVSLSGRLREGEMEEYLKGGSRERRVDPPADPAAASERCLHCDCRKFAECRLRRYAEVCGADRAAFAGERRTFERRIDHPQVVYEPGKCIACGLCVRITEEAREELGLTFVGRGFDVRIGVPFGKGLEEGLRRTAERCVRACPTGALARRDDAGAGK